MCEQEESEGMLYRICELTRAAVMEVVDKYVPDTHPIVTGEITDPEENRRLLVATFLGIVEDLGAGQHQRVPDSAGTRSLRKGDDGEDHEGRCRG